MRDAAAGGAAALGVPIPAEWTGAAVTAGELGPEWWTDFGDEELSAAIETVLSRNLDLAAAAARLEQAAADARVASGALRPTIQASYNGSRRKQNFVGFPIPGAEDEVLSTVFTNQGVSLDTTWEVDLWGKLQTTEQAALAELQRSAADLRAAQLSMAGQTAKAWFAIAEAQQQVVLTETTVESLGESVERVRDRFESGVRPALDVRLALVNLSNARGQLTQRRQQLDASRRQLEVLLAQYAGGDISPPPDLPEMPPAVPAGVPANLVGRRPDLVAAERQVAASEARLRVARRELLPTFSLTVNTGTATDALRDLLSGDFAVWSLVGNVLAPLWQGGKLRAQVNRAEAQVAEVLASYVNTALTAYSEVDTALAAEEHLAERVDHLTTSVEQARAAERLADERYRTGLDSYITVLDSQRSAFQAESELIAARRLRLENRVDSLPGPRRRLRAPRIAGHDGQPRRGRLIRFGIRKYSHETHNARHAQGPSAAAHRRRGRCRRHDDDREPPAGRDADAGGGAVRRPRARGVAAGCATGRDEPGHGPAAHREPAGAPDRGPRHLGRPLVRGGRVLRGRRRARQARPVRLPTDVGQRPVAAGAGPAGAGAGRSRGGGGAAGAPTGQRWMSRTAWQSPLPTTGGFRSP